MIKNQIHCLLLEDSPVDRKLMESMMDDNIVVISAESLAGAIDQLSQHTVDIIISNLGLPDSYGLDTFTKLYEIMPNIPIIVLTALDNESIALDAVKGGAQDYILKGDITRRSLNRSIKYAIERKQIEEQLREAELRYKTVADFTYAWEYWQLRDGTLKYVSPACEKITGYSIEEFVQNPGLIEDIILPEDQKIWEEHTKQNADGHAPEIQYRIVTKDGNIRWVAHNCNRIVEDGENLGYRASNRDITQQKEDEERKKNLQTQLAESQKMETLGTLVGGIAHEFNNLLTSLMGYADMCLAKIPPNSQIYSDIENITKNVNHAKTLVQQMLTFTRQGTQERKIVNIYDTVQAAVQVARMSLPSTIEIKKNIDPNTGTILADPSQISQIIINIFTNSYQAMKKTGGVLSISLDNVEIDSEFATQHPNLRKGKYVRIIISDTGVGIEKNIIEKIFDPFFTTRKVGEGTGLGLSVVHGIVMSHGGRITVSSEVGKGTSMIIYLPQVIGKEPATKTPAPEKPKTPEAKETYRILYVDDEPEIAIMVKKMLEMFKYEVVIKNDSTAALKIFQETPEAFDLVITDQTMPYMTGLQLAQKIHEVRDSVPMIIVTGFSEDISKENYQDFGFQDYISKPFVINDIKTAIERVLK
jgi:PAS domain S-box-containing protein